MRSCLVVAAALAFTALVIFPTCQAECDAKPKKGIRPKAIPNLLKNYKDGWKLTAEISDSSEKSTYYLVEYYDPVKKQGFLRFKKDGGDDINLYYKSRTRELFVYQNSKWDMGYGTWKSLPLRITSGSQTVDVMMLQPYFFDDDDVLKIPMGKGCKRLAPDIPSPPNFSNLDLEFHVEMAFTNPTVLGSVHYLSHLEVLHSVKDNLLSVTGEDWYSVTPEQLNSSVPLVSMQRIYDYANGHVYSYVDSGGMFGCKVEARDNVAPAIEFPDRNEVNLLDTILPTYKILSNASYLGIEDEYMDTAVNRRNLPVQVAMHAYQGNKIDFTENMAYITVLILAHPAISADYDEIPKMKVVEPEWTEGVITRDNCLKVCSSKHYANCSAVSYCGSVCMTTTKTNVNSSDVLLNSDDCSTYVKTERSKKRNVVLTRDAISDLEDALKKSEFKIIVMHLSTRIALASLVAETIEYSTGGLRDMIGESNPDLRHLHQQNNFQPPEGFEQYLVVTALKTDMPYGKYAGSFELADCADICRDREDCFAFSTCLVSKQCVISTEARKPAFEETEYQGDCTMYTKSYESKFEELPGICYSFAATKYVAASVASECAVACLNEKEFACKAFDFCLAPKQNGGLACRLQDRHILQVNGTTEIDRSGAEKCSHYTREHHFEDTVPFLGLFLSNSSVLLVTCGAFDHCSGKQEQGKGDCLLFDGDKEPYGTVMSPICSSYTYTGKYIDQVARAPQALHSNAKATGLSFIMIFMGVGIALAAIFAYGFYKTRRAGRQQD
ncbi:hypothetical protein HPB50_012670 [Hyalomma asiaticum]|uniref:Uncharacterized protein n=1 Tax=Hyalomma asiaticum TaxID=266040 RepID=A0ACB7RIW4_HYAAI|nr:hypothetical protein HPB50_012670 [Hyalomma asiaticum]